MSFYVYLLLSTDNCTYIGATINLENRLRKHNKEITGGAYATGKRVEKGEVWVRAAYVEGFPDWVSALQFEWKWKYISRKDKEIRKINKPLERRMAALKQLIHSERPTSKSKAFSEWPTPPRIVFEDPEVETIYTQCKPNLT